MDKKLILGLVLAILGFVTLAGGGSPSGNDVVSAVPTEDVKTTTVLPPEDGSELSAKESDGEAGPAQTTGREVVINGRALKPSLLREFAELYGVEPAPGDYWYDSRSGLYGAVGQAAAGFMLPGHDFGPVSADASRGDTGVIVNGRIIPQDEHMVLNLIWGEYVQPTRYWLDAWGNVGYEGMDVPIGNLFVQIQTRIQVGGGAGDNIWSSRYGGGNYTPDNSAGYVSVPGHGPIGYGN
jgi:hypothetical protein